MPIPVSTGLISKSLSNSPAQTLPEFHSLPAAPQPDSTDCDSHNYPNVDVTEAHYSASSKRPRNQHRVADCYLALSPIEKQQRVAVQSFNQFIKSAGGKKDDVLIGLVRNMRTYVKFCKDCEDRGFEEAFALQISRHRYIEKPCYLKVRATEETKSYFRELWERVRTLAPSCAQREVIYDALIEKVKSMKRQFSKSSQAALYRSKEARMIYYHLLAFLDHFERDGNTLKTALKLQCETAELRENLYFEYMHSLGLAPYDGLCFHKVFHVQYVKFPAS